MHPGQDAEVKVETFPFTKYGTLHGKITQVSSDAIQDEKLGLICSTRVNAGQGYAASGKQDGKDDIRHGGDG